MEKVIYNDARVYVYNNKKALAAIITVKKNDINIQNPFGYAIIVDYDHGVFLDAGERRKHAKPVFISIKKYRKNTYKVEVNQGFMRIHYNSNKIKR